MLRLYNSVKSAIYWAIYKQFLLPCCLLSEANLSLPFKASETIWTDGEESDATVHCALEHGCFLEALPLKFSSLLQFSTTAGKNKQFCKQLTELRSFWFWRSIQSLHSFSSPGEISNISQGTSRSVLLFHDINKYHLQIQEKWVFTRLAEASTLETLTPVKFLFPSPQSKAAVNLPTKLYLIRSVGWKHSPTDIKICFLYIRKHN